MLISTVKLALLILILLLSGAAAPLTTNALIPNKSAGDDMFPPFPRQILSTSYHGMNTAMPDPNSIQFLSGSNLTSSPIPHQLMSISHPSSMNASFSNPNSVQFLPGSNLNIRNGSDSHYYNNSGAWSNRTPFGFWNPIFAAAPFLNIPKNLIVPPACGIANSSQVCPTIVEQERLQKDGYDKYLTSFLNHKSIMSPERYTYRPSTIYPNIGSDPHYVAVDP